MSEEEVLRLHGASVEEEEEEEEEEEKKKSFLYEVTWCLTDVIGG